jgi:hypothetical protein
VKQASVLRFGALPAMLISIGFVTLFPPRKAKFLVHFWQKIASEL